jgi:hypothetical protein
MDVNRIKLLIVTLVAMLSLALSASGTLAHHKHGPLSKPQENCGYVLTGQGDREKGTSTNCQHSPLRSTP